MLTSVVAYAANMLLFLCSFIFLFGSVLCCHTFYNTGLSVVSISGETVQTTVTGCIERKTLDVRDPVEIHVRGENIRTLRRDDVRHLVKLTTITFKHCHIKNIERSLFRNTPQLKSIEVTFNDLTEVKSGIFTTLPNLEVLQLHNNYIEKIEDGAFGNSTTLREVRCHHNLLEEWREAWFNTSTNVEVMDFRFNRINMLSNFTKFTKLSEVYFDHNHLEVITVKAFDGLKRLHYLGLRYNKLVTLDWNIFPWDFSIDVLSIGANYLNYLPRKVMAMITVKELELQGNPWKCPCLDQIFNWLYEMNATVRNDDSCSGKHIPVCCYSSTFPYSCLEKTDRQATLYYLGKLSALTPPLKPLCARLTN